MSPPPATGNTTPALDPWFPVKITVVDGTEYEFDEWHLNGNGDWEAKPGGRVGTSLNPGVAITGTFAVDDFAQARSAPGAGGTLWELLPLNVAGPTGPAGGITSWKDVVRVATTTAGTLATSFENGDTVDGITLGTGDRILIKNQASAAENGIYTVNASGAPTRATDADAGSELVGATVYVSEGTVNADSIWSCTTNATITLGVSNLTWVCVAPGQLTHYASTISLNIGTGTRNAWVDLAGSSALITLTRPGKYILHCNLAAAIDHDASGGPIPVPSTIYGAIYNITGSAFVASGVILLTEVVSAGFKSGSLCVTVPFTLAPGTSAGFKLQYYWECTGGSLNAYEAAVGNNFGNSLFAEYVSP